MVILRKIWPNVIFANNFWFIKIISTNLGFVKIQLKLNHIRDCPKSNFPLSVNLISAESHWRVSGWSDCRPLSPESQCGFGSQTRNLSCVLFPSWPREETDPARCGEVKAPAQERLCAVRCGRDCELGPWQGWARCQCGRGVTARVRRVVSPPVQAGAQCPPRVERRLCPPSPPCSSTTPGPPLVLGLREPRQVTVYVGPWSNCSLPAQPSKRSLVGAGRFLPGEASLQEGQLSSPPPQIGQSWRSVLCRGEEGESLPWSHCMDGSRATVVPADKQSCVMSRDCRVGQWSDWARQDNSDFCGQSGERRERRLRQILSFSEGAGRPCPHLQQTRPAQHQSGQQCQFRWESLVFDMLIPANTCYPSYQISMENWLLERV